MEDLSAFSAKPRLRLLLDHFSKIKDGRQAWKVAYPLREVLFLVVCGTIANCDDYAALVERLDLEGALVSIDAMGCNPNIAQSILDAKADYLLAVKDNQPTLHTDIKSYFETAPTSEVEQVETVGKDHGRIEMRTHTVSHVVDWYAAQRAIRAPPASRNSPPSPWSKAASSAATRSRANSDPISPPARSRPQHSRTPHEAIGASKTTFTGPSP